MTTAAQLTQQLWAFARRQRQEPRRVDARDAMSGGRRMGVGAPLPHERARALPRAATSAASGAAGLIFPRPAADTAGIPPLG
jgi:hypothetical protein